MRGWRSRCIALSILIMTAVLVVPAAFAQTTYSFNLPEQPLADSLRAIGQQTEINILFEPDAVRSVRSPALRGSYTADDAIRWVLKGTKLEAQHTTATNVVVKLRSATSTASPGVTATPASGPGDRLAQSSVTGSQSQSNIDGPQNTSASSSQSDSGKSKLSEIVVTGTHIEGSINPTAPMIVINRADIERSGYTNTQELVAAIPQNFGGGSANATADGVLGAGTDRLANDSFGTGINLRGLGPSSTLVLINGQRMASSAEGLFVDVSVIPLAAIDRVEIMTDGASAIYGSDAVAGVVNFVLKKDYEGAQTWASYGSGTQGNEPRQETVGQTVGGAWSGGNAIGSVQYQHSGALSAADRSFTDTVYEPTYLLPESSQYSGLFSVRQDLGPGFDISSDVLYSHSEKEDYTTKPSYSLYYAPTSDQGMATVSLGYRPSKQWHIGATVSYSLTDTQSVVDYTIPTNCNGPCDSRDNYRETTAELVADGTLFRVPGGDVKTAVGLSYQHDDFSNFLVYLPSSSSDVDRHVTAEFAEVQIPVVGLGNAISLLRQLDLSLAVRHDDYSDFGSTTNPRYGIAWKPVDELRVRVAYSTSFRAPNAYEESGRALPPYLYEGPVAAPSGTGTVPVFYLLQNPNTTLEPEKSQNVTAGIDFAPAELPGLKVSLDYYNIHYRDRLITPTFPNNVLSQLGAYGPLTTSIPSDAAAQAYISQVESQGGMFYDGVGTNGAGVRYLLNGYQQNAALENVSGIDFTGKERFSFAGNEFRVGLNVAYIAHLDTQFTVTSQSTDLINTYGNPLHWRGRGELGWTRGPWSINTALNYSGSYVDTSSPTSNPVASWTTIDAQLAYKPPAVKGLLVTLSGTNIFDRNPPYVAGIGEYFGDVHYDVGNASPLGRVVVLGVKYDW